MYQRVYRLVHERLPARCSRMADALTISAVGAIAVAEKFLPEEEANELFSWLVTVMVDKAVPDCNHTSYAQVLATVCDALLVACNTPAEGSCSSILFASGARQYSVDGMDSRGAREPALLLSYTQLAEAFRAATGRMPLPELADLRRALVALPHKGRLSAQQWVHVTALQPASSGNAGCEDAGSSDPVLHHVRLPANRLKATTRAPLVVLYTAQLPRQLQVLVAAQLRDGATAAAAGSKRSRTSEDGSASLG
jgi:hypothetical protein